MNRLTIAEYNAKFKRNIEYKVIVIKDRLVKINNLQSKTRNVWTGEETEIVIEYCKLMGKIPRTKGIRVIYFQDKIKSKNIKEINDKISYELQKLKKETHI